ncbi:MAG: glycosyltransferase family 4 protein [Chloroflexi bacterium]|nr:glycosyltransferase family 4 protein [Chloroflexota bacterium]
MEIAQITSTYLSVPPKSHGGTELMVYHLVEGLVRRGHKVELFASGDSRVSAKVNSVVDVATSYDEGATFYIDKEMEARNTFNLYRQGQRFDIIHAHWPTLAPYFSGSTDTPTVLTYAYIERPLHEYYRATFPNINPVCVSKSQARMLGEEGLPVVYNGIDVSNVPFGREPEDFLVIVGRIVPNKGIADAIRIAAAAGERLVIVGAVTPYLPWSQRYYDEEVEPFVDGDRVRHIHHLPNREVLELIGRAKAFLFPLQWEEPFGLAVAEAMAAGTPVVTYPKGAMPEVVIDGETGFLVETEAEAARALGRIGEIDRRRCRRSVEERFPIEGMVAAYERLYGHVCRES